MALDTRIPLSFRGPQVNAGDIRQIGADFQQRKMLEQQQAEREEDRTFKREEFDFRRQGRKDATAKAEQERVARSILRASVLVNGHLSNGDVDGAISSLENNIAEIELRGEDASHSRKVLDQLRQDPARVLAQTGQVISTAERFKELAPRAQATAPTTREVKRGSEIITEQFNPSTGQFEEIARGARFGPRAVNNINVGTGGFKPEKGFMLDPQNPGRVVPIPGGTVEAERAENTQKAALRADAFRGKARSVSAAIRGARQLINKTSLLSPNMTTGLSGQLLKGVGGTDARNLKSKLDTIKANLAFGELQAMREASKTGGALGAVAVRELELLEAGIASLDQAQDADQLNKGIDLVEIHYNKALQALDAAKNQGGDSATPRADPNADIETMSTEDLYKIVNGQ